MRAALPQHEARRETIRKLVRNQRIATQEDLRRLLGREGFRVTQATLSRDLAQLGARRASVADGGSGYELADLPLPSRDETDELADLVVSVRDNGTMVVLQTHSGAASAVALAIDKARLPEVLGTLAGDDTIFVAPSRGTTAARASKRLMELWGKGGNR